LAEVGKKALSHSISTRILPSLGFERLDKPHEGKLARNSFKPHTSDGVNGVKHQVIIVHEIDHPDFHSATNTPTMMAALERHLQKATGCNEISVEKVGKSLFIKHPHISVQYEAQ